ncbi:DUF397 domain-containing protein [Streptomyces sp. CC224B]|uniref:DUF397 domain-containing protein n=1 Tax=Streptomyces sp. CC224B TaxID=3044571 RepID=UPI0024A7B260|nr:DUF397 domain-containing protein [Streptomyces sp. CC224B]
MAVGSQWRKSSYSEPNACVEVDLSTSPRVRDSRNTSAGHLQFSIPAWRCFIHSLKGSRE